MTYRLEIDSGRRLALFTVSGAFPRAELLRMVREMLDHPEFRTGYDALVDLTAVEDISLFGADIRAKVELDRTLLPQLGSGKWAIVATRDSVFGLSRLFQTLMDNAPVEVGTFRDLEEAQAWLDER